MATVSEEYNRLARHIENQFGLMVQVFYVSVIASVALLGYTFHVLFDATPKISACETFFMFVPLVIVFPCALIIFSLRREIFKWGGYIKIYLNDGKNWRYETELDKYRRRFPENESFDAIAITYTAIVALCVLLFGLAISKASMPLFWIIWALVPVGLALWWWLYYRDIPRGYSEKCEKRWSEIAATNTPNRQMSNNRSKNDEPYEKIDKLFKRYAETQSLQSAAYFSLATAVALWALSYLVTKWQLYLLLSAGFLWLIGLGLSIYLLVRISHKKQG